MRNRDADYPFRHDSYFYYLTGFTEPEATLVLDASADGGRAGCHPVLPREERRARNVGRLPLRPGRRTRGVRLRRRVPHRSNSTRKCRAFSPITPALHYALGTFRRARRTGSRLARRRCGHRAAAACKRPSKAHRPAARARRNAPRQRRARTRDHAARRHDLRRSAPPRDANLPPRHARIRTRSRAALHVPPTRRASARVRRRSSRPARMPACCTTRRATRSCARAT